MSKAKVTQGQRVIRHLKDYGSISTREAMNDYGIMRLASRVSDLKKDGYDIRTRMISDKNRYGEKTSYARYVLEG